MSKIQVANMESGNMMVVETQKFEQLVLELPRLWAKKVDSIKLSLSDIKSKVVDINKNITKLSNEQRDIKSKNPIPTLEQRQQIRDLAGQTRVLRQQLVVHRGNLEVEKKRLVDCSLQMKKFKKIRNLYDKFLEDWNKEYRLEYLSKNIYEEMGCE